MRHVLPLFVLGSLLFGYGFFLYTGGKVDLSLSPGLMPMLLGSLTMILSFFHHGQWKRGKFPLRRGGFVLMYLLLWYLVGFWISSLVFCFLGFYVLAEKKPLQAGLYSLLLTLSIDLLFARFFGILLP